MRLKESRSRQTEFKLFRLTEVLLLNDVSLLSLLGFNRTGHEYLFFNHILKVSIIEVSLNSVLSGLREEVHSI